MDKLIKSNILFDKLRSYYPKLNKNESEIGEALLKVIKLKTKEFGSNLKKLRLAAGIHQSVICSNIDCHQGTFSSWENGLHVPKIGIIYKIINYLAIDPSELIEYNEHQANNFEITTVSQNYFQNINTTEKFNQKLNLQKDSEEQPEQIKTDEFYFAYRVTDESMMPDTDTSRSIPKNSILFVKKIDDTNMKTNELLQFLNGKVVVANISGSASFLREVFFDGVNLVLNSWNTRYPSIRFNLVDADKDDCTINRIREICFFGIATMGQFKL